MAATQTPSAKVAKTADRAKAGTQYRNCVTCGELVRPVKVRPRGGRGHMEWRHRDTLTPADAACTQEVVQ